MTGALKYSMNHAAKINNTLYLPLNSELEMVNACLESMKRQIYKNLIPKGTSHLQSKNIEVMIP